MRFTERLRTSISQSVFDDPKAARQPSATVEITESELNHLLFTIDTLWTPKARRESLKDFVNKSFGSVQGPPAASEPKSPLFEPSPSSCSFNSQRPVDRVSHLAPPFTPQPEQGPSAFAACGATSRPSAFGARPSPFPSIPSPETRRKAAAFPFLFPDQKNNSVRDGVDSQYLKAARTYSERLGKTGHPKNAQQAQKKRAGVSKRHDADPHSSTINEATNSFADQQLDWESRISKLERRLNVTKCVHCRESLTPTCKCKENTWLASQVGKYVAEMENLNDRFAEQLPTQFEALGINLPNPQQSAAAKSSQERIDKLQGEIMDLELRNWELCTDNDKLKALLQSRYPADSHDVGDWYNGDWSDW